MKTVLVTNAQQRKALAVARSLGRRGIKIIAAEETLLNPTAFSRYCSKALVYPSPKRKPEEFYSWLKDALLEYKCDILYPMDDDVMEIVMGNYEELKAICSMAVPSVESYRTACDKGEALRLAIDVGMECPGTVFIECLEDLREVASRISYPAVIKPRKSSGSRGISVAYTERELISKYYKTHQDYPFPIIQEYIGIGERYDVCFLFDGRNILKASFVQKELRHFPIPMGPSTLQESIEYPELLEKALSMAKSLEWFGVIEMEFMVDDRDGRPKFMEINPRFWASVQTAILSGIDFPWLLYRIMTEDEIEEYVDYKKGIKCRWLLPGDIFHYITNKERKRMSPSFWLGQKHGIYDDIICKEDPIPLLGFFLACLRYAFDLSMWKLIFKR